VVLFLPPPRTPHGDPAHSRGSFPAGRPPHQALVLQAACRAAHSAGRRGRVAARPCCRRQWPDCAECIPCSSKCRASGRAALPFERPLRPGRPSSGAATSGTRAGAAAPGRGTFLDLCFLCLFSLFLLALASPIAARPGLSRWAQASGGCDRPRTVPLCRRARPPRQISACTRA
jgi:hypothetical protein